jgi:hypothetical protein
MGNKPQDPPLRCISPWSGAVAVIPGVMGRRPQNAGCYRIAGAPPRLPDRRVAASVSATVRV